eukprot:13063933-Alexandrium_andersonii.AAC.1
MNGGSLFVLRSTRPRCPRRRMLSAAPVLNRKHCDCGLRRTLRREAVIHGDLRRSPVDVRGRVAGSAGHTPPRATSAPRPKRHARAL